MVSTSEPQVAPLCCGRDDKKTFWESTAPTSPKPLIPNPYLEES